MSNVKPTTADTPPSRWTELLLWAILAAVLLEFGFNIIRGHSIWQRLDRLEFQMDQIEHSMGIHPGAR